MLAAMYNVLVDRKEICPQNFSSLLCSFLEPFQKDTVREVAWPCTFISS